MAKKEEDPLFVGITNADELRRSVLECSKDILESLRSYEKFKSLKEEKLNFACKIPYFLVFWMFQRYPILTELWGQRKSLCLRML